MSLIRKIDRTVRRGLKALVDVNVRYTRVVHGGHVLSDAGGGRAANAPRANEDGNRPAA